jgi:hypothetical protein
MICLVGIIIVVLADAIRSRALLRLRGRATSRTQHPYELSRGRGSERWRSSEGLADGDEQREDGGPFGRFGSIVGGNARRGRPGR